MLVEPVITDCGSSGSLISRLLLKMACQKMLRLGDLMNRRLLSNEPSSLIFFKTYANGGGKQDKRCPKKPEKKPPKEIDPNKKVAIVLSGCGMLDGSEIHEAVATAVHVNRCGLHPTFYAPYCLQADVVDHKTGGRVDEDRNCLVEAARIARGKIKCLSHLNTCDAGALVFPGGFGVGKTLSTYAKDKANCNLNQDVIRVLTEFQEAKKPMGFMCISAVLPARMFPCVKVTLGMKGDTRKWPHAEAIEHAQEMGATVEARPVNDFSFDRQYLVFSTPAYMYNGTFNQIFDGIGIMIDMMSKIME